MTKLERFGHGGDLETAVELYGYDKRQWLDFSANIYPYGPPCAVIKHLQSLLNEPGFHSLTHYPDPDSRKLRQRIGEHHQIDIDWVMVGNGGAELIDLVIHGLAPKRVGVLEPAFSEYSSSARKRNVSVQSIVSDWEKGFIPDPEEVAQLIASSDLVFIGVPNNPTGHLIPVSLLREWARMAAMKKTWLVIDEAFLDFVIKGEEHSLIREIDRYPTTFILRSMTKFYALPGLRLGYMIGHPDVLRRIKEQQVPWSVNALAQEAGAVALLPEVHAPYANEVHQWLQETRLELMELFKDFHELEVFSGEANYFLLRLTAPGYTSIWLQEELGKKGILIRDCSMYPGLDERYFRIAIKKREQNQVLVQALQEVLCK
ncbi:threonine-phosphate decarboxylase CobD [Thermoflavimicrobium dichotomicum]|uniref:threonine-phosphate decarboxylase n=1 Tax=Thermoflavimicrobium dichotomicum TaxID=46223 RepID=A0A1I3MHI9_9BACL|nr:threonine-phosphate decarboxylase CobD [Thermoflavimicrobium dichotomicum]SFI96478.1 threonine-phosphate decarboxylase [Thermoflavimicrobium dichotomicum]